MTKRILISSLFVLMSIVTLYSETFKFRYTEDERYRILSRVDEYVYINGEFSHRADILNKISVHVTGVSGGKGQMKAVFQTSERSSGASGVYEWGTEYDSEFSRDSRGLYDIERKYFMPVVRDVPVFPERDLVPGDTWSWKASEVHDFRKNFGIPDAYHIPIYVNYTYLGKGEYEGREFDRFSVRYNVFFRPDAQPAGARVYPRRISGMSDQLLYWDNEAGRPHAYEENFEFVFELSTGDRVEYKGLSDAHVIESPDMDRQSVARGVRESLDMKGVENADVTIGEKGVTITLTNIQFSPDSARLLDSEKGKLDSIAEILAAYPERDVLVEGFTAMAGTSEGRLRLSEQRARAVADYLLSTGCKPEEQMIMRGRGGEDPVADNTTEEGMRKNRRVEITILEN